MNGYSNLCIAICGFFISILCNICFFKKERLVNKETSIFARVLIYGLVDSTLMIVMYCIALFYQRNELLLVWLNKTDYAMYILWSSNFFLYIYYVITKDNEKNGSKYYKFFFWLTTIVDLIIILCIALLKVEIHNERLSAMYSDGSALTAMIVGCGIYIFAIIICLLKNIKKVFTRKLTPLYILILFMGLVAVLNKVDNTIVIISAVLAYINLILFFTIENPDMKMLRQVELARDTAERANKAKTDFLSSMSHEIRTPLNAIVGFSECIAREETLEAAKEDAKDIVMASQNLLEIVNGILDISKIESGKMELVETDYDLHKIAEDLQKLMIPRIGEKPIKFTVELAPDIPGVLHGDGTKIKQIMSNILTNAIKYTEIGEIKFKVKCINEQSFSKIMISVEDTGRGIKPEKIDKLFDKFSRLEEDRNTTTEGTGLGLAITKKLVEMMNGKITVQSKYGEGSLFTVYLVQRIVSLSKKQEIENLDFYDNFSSKKVLVVDDNKLNIKIASKLLSEYKINIVEALSGIECIEKIDLGEKFDLILMDDMMPNMSGTETMKKLKEKGVETPIVVLTANAIEGMRENYLSEGFNYYMSKPIDKQELEKVLNMYLGGNPHKESPLGPIPEEMFKITEEDIREIDELMPRSEIDKINEQINEEQNKPVEEKKEEITVEEQKEFEEIVEETPEVEVALNDFEISNEETTSIEKTSIVEENNTSNKGSKKFLEDNDINVDRGLELLGDMEMYDETLQGFLEESDHRVKEMEQYKNANDMPNYAIHAHAMKSDSKYLGFTHLADLSLQHELKAKDNDSDFVNNHYQELMDELNRILCLVKEYLGK